MVATASKPPEVATFAKPQGDATSANLPNFAAAAKLPVFGTSDKLPVIGGSEKLPCVGTSPTDAPRATSSFIESNWEAPKDDDSASKLQVPGGHIETIDGATTNTSASPNTAYYHEITRQLEKHLRYYHKELLSYLHLETPQTGRITPIRGEMKQTDEYHV